MSNGSLKIKYDRASDVLYINTRPGVPAVVRHGDPGLLWRHDANTGELIGLTVIDFDLYWRPRLRELAAQLSLRLKVPKDATEHALREVA